MIIIKRKEQERKEKTGRVGGHSRWVGRVFFSFFLHQRFREFIDSRSPRGNAENVDGTEKREKRDLCVCVCVCVCVHVRPHGVG